MPRRTKSVPTYRHHKPSGQAVVTLKLPGGARKDVYLGAFDSPESKAEYARLVALGSRAAAHFTSASSDLSVNELLLAFMEWAIVYYRTPDGEETSEVASLRRALAPVKKLFGTTPAVEFGPRSLDTVRRHMIAAGLCRSLINKRIDRVRRVWKWAAAEERVHVSAYEALRTLAGLRAGRTEARESEPVKPVEPAHVEKTLPHLNRHVRAMVELQRLTGMRPGEVCRLSLAEVDRSGELWVYRPGQHKTRHRGKGRAIPLGPRARAILAEFASADEAAPVFNPRVAREERYAGMRVKRKSKVPPSQVKRRVKNPKRSPGDRYTPESYAHAVGFAAKTAGVPHWHPNQLRHTFASEVRRIHGLEAAQVLLGHSRADVTQVYAERDFALAAKVARVMG